MEARRNLSVSYNTIGDIAKARGMLGEAEKWYCKSLALSESLADETENVVCRDDLAVSYYKIGILKEDKAMLKRALSIWEQLTELCPDTPRYRENAKIAKRAVAELPSGLARLLRRLRRR